MGFRVLDKKTQMLKWTKRWPDKSIFGRTMKTERDIHKYW